MRPVLFFVVPVLISAPAYAGSHAWTQGRPLFPAPHIDFSHVGIFDAPVTPAEGSDLMLRRQPTLPVESEKSILPSIKFGPFHATVSGVNEGAGRTGAYQLDTRDFWNSSISGSVDNRGARVTFTLPTH